LQFRFDLLTAHLFRNVGYSYPEQTDGQWMVGGLIIDRDLDLVGLVNVKLVQLVQPTIVPGWLRAALYAVFNFDINKSLWTTAKTTRRRMVNVSYGVNAQGQMPAQGLSLARHVQTVICALSATAHCNHEEL
jgi:hypothetical protein